MGKYLIVVEDRAHPCSGVQILNLKWGKLHIVGSESEKDSRSTLFLDGPCIDDNQGTLELTLGGSIYYRNLGDYGARIGDTLYTDRKRRRVELMKEIGFGCLPDDSRVGYRYVITPGRRK
tara:strand:- start:79 stop:438 length:360 start_codon:yes stop_codon:yes gene_type:complete